MVGKEFQWGLLEFVSIPSECYREACSFSFPLFFLRLQWRCCTTFLIRPSECSLTFSEKVSFARPRSNSSAPARQPSDVWTTNTERTETSSSQINQYLLIRTISGPSSVCWLKVKTNTYPLSPAASTLCRQADTNRLNNTRGWSLGLGRPRTEEKAASVKRAEEKLDRGESSHSESARKTHCWVITANSQHILSPRSRALENTSAWKAQTPTNHLQQQEFSSSSGHRTLTLKGHTVWSFPSKDAPGLTLDSPKRLFHRYKGTVRYLNHTAMTQNLQHALIFQPGSRVSDTSAAQSVRLNRFFLSQSLFYWGLWLFIVFLELFFYHSLAMWWIPNPVLVH